MKSESIFKKLLEFLTPREVEHLKIIHKGCNGEIVICLAISDISKEYNSTDKNEREVAYLLALLCKNHFAKVTKIIGKDEIEMKTEMSNIKFSEVTYQQVKFYPDRKDGWPSKKESWGLQRTVAFYQEYYKRYQVVAIDGYGRTNHVILGYIDKERFEKIDAPKYWKKIYDPALVDVPVS